MSSEILKGSVTVSLVHDDRDLREVMAVRAAVYLGEEKGRYQDHFDDNDYCSSFLLARIESEPVGVMRIRWFAEFARLEKMTIRGEYRNFTVLRALVNKAFELCLQKGYRTVCGQARLAVVPFWRRLGGREAGPPRETIYGPMTPIILDLPAPRNDGPIGWRRVDIGTPEFESRIYDWEGGRLQA
ncbi:MAG: GNAT family N-acetyltransferase [Alphaproteobacteria bacterium]|nr:GNAT family N-acetyltransferase [Alphaproteobacteria bacterium]